MITASKPWRWAPDEYGRITLSRSMQCISEEDRLPDWMDAIFGAKVSLRRYHLRKRKRIKGHGVGLEVRTCSQYARGPWFNAQYREFKNKMLPRQRRHRLSLRGQSQPPPRQGFLCPVFLQSALISSKGTYHTVPCLQACCNTGLSWDPP